MSYTAPDFADDVTGAAQADGYSIHGGDENHEPRGEEDAEVFWFAWSAGGADVELGDDFDSALGAWMSALQHRLANSAILGADGQPLLPSASTTAAS